MKAKDFYKQELAKGSSHDDKFKKGKNYYSDLLHSFLIDYCYHTFFKNRSVVKVLEIGTFTGRITKKLMRYFSDITLSDIDATLIYSPSPDWNKIELDLSKPFNNDKFKEKFDFVISLGHQVSFSGHIELALLNVNYFLKKGGITLFDIWNKEFIYNHLVKPPYEYSMATVEEIKKLVSEYLEIIDIFYGPRLNYLCGRYSSLLVEKFVKKGNIWSRLYCAIENIFKKSHSKFLLRRTQSLIFVGSKK
jgi:SAM-dependent methyltransferase